MKRQIFIVLICIMLIFSLISCKNASSGNGLKKSTPKSGDTIEPIVEDEKGSDDEIADSETTEYSGKSILQG